MKKNYKKWLACASLGAICVACSALAFSSTSSTVKGEEQTLFTCSEGATVTMDAYMSDWTVKGYGGVLVEATQDCTVTLNRPLDVSENTRENVFAEILTVPTVIGSEDFTSMVVRLTDAEDPTNFLRMQLYTGTTSLYQNQGALAVSAASPYTNAYYFYSTAKNAPTRHETGGSIISGASFTGYGNYTGGAPASTIKLSYDAATHSVYARGADTNDQIFVADLSDTAYTGLGYEWYGFPSGKAYLSIETHGLKSQKLSYMITTVNDQSYAGEKIVDVKNPKISVDTQGYDELPIGQVGKEYKIFSATAYDEIDGWSEPKINVSYYDAEYPSTGTGFTPNKPGRYDVNYSVKDKAGNEANASVTVLVESKAREELYLDFSVNDTAFDILTEKEIVVGNNIKLPDAIYGGGSGRAVIDVSVKKLDVYGNNPRDVQLTQNSFVVESEGYYVVTYKATDYLNDSIEKSFRLKATYSSEPIVEWPNAPQYMIVGKTYKLYDFTANVFDAENNFGVSASKKIIVKDSSGTTEYASDNALYTAKGNAGETVTVTYVAENPTLKTAKAEKTYEIPLVQPQKLYEYFYDATKTITATYDGVNMLTDYVTTADATMRFLNALPISSFKFDFKVLPKYANFSALKLTLTDVINTKEKIELTIVNENGNPYLYVNGKRTTELNGEFGVETNDVIALGLDKEYNVVGHAGLKLDKLSKTVYGENFNGFSGRKFYLDVSFENVTGEAGITLYSFCGLTLSTSKKDGQGPIIELLDPLVLEHNTFERCKLPAARAVDVLDPFSNITVSMTDADGNYVKDLTGKDISGIDATVAVEYAVEKVGSYKIVYTAVDSIGNPRKATYTVLVVEKNPPTINLDGEIKTEAKVGDKIKLPNASVKDDTDTNAKLFVYYTEPNGKRVVLSGKSFTVTKKGTYKLYYYACDQYYNGLTLCFTIVVK